MNKKINIILTILLITLCTVNVFAINVPEPAPTNNDEIKTLILADGAKTRQDLKTYTDSKIDNMINTVRTDGQKYINDDFSQLWGLLKQTAETIVLKISIAVFSSILLAQALWYLIRRKIEKLERKRPHQITKTEYEEKRSSLIKSDWEKPTEEILEEHRQMMKDSNDIRPEVPRTNVIIKMFRERKKRKEAEKRKKRMEKISKQRAKAQKELDKINRQEEEISGISPSDAPR